MNKEDQIFEINAEFNSPEVKEWLESVKDKVSEYIRPTIQSYLNKLALYDLVEQEVLDLKPNAINKVQSLTKVTSRANLILEVKKWIDQAETDSLRFYNKESSEKQYESDKEWLINKILCYIYENIEGRVIR